MAPLMYEACRLSELGPDDGRRPVDGPDPFKHEAQGALSGHGPKRTILRRPFSELADRLAPSLSAMIERLSMLGRRLVRYVVLRRDHRVEPGDVHRPSRPLSMFCASVKT
jgi:hypothetical protein